LIVANLCSAKLLKKLMGKKEMEDALKRLDKLTQDEARMAAAENLKLTHVVDNKVTSLINGTPGMFRTWGPNPETKQVVQHLAISTDNVKCL
jgi:hypothetical protein